MLPAHIISCRYPSISLPILIKIGRGQIKIHWKKHIVSSQHRKAARSFHIVGQHFGFIAVTNLDRVRSTNRSCVGRALCASLRDSFLQISANLCNTYRIVRVSYDRYNPSSYLCLYAITCEVKYWKKAYYFCQ